MFEGTRTAHSSHQKYGGSGEGCADGQDCFDALGQLGAETLTMARNRSIIFSMTCFEHALSDWKGGGTILLVFISRSALLGPGKENGPTRLPVRSFRVLHGTVTSSVTRQRCSFLYLRNVEDGSGPRRINRRI